MPQQISVTDESGQVKMKTRAYYSTGILEIVNAILP